MELGILFNAHITAHYALCDLPCGCVFPRYFLKKLEEQHASEEAVSDTDGLFAIMCVCVCVCVCVMKGQFPDTRPDFCC